MEPDILKKYKGVAEAYHVHPHYVSEQIGHLLSVLVKSVNARSVLEIGTLWGYSTWWLNEGLAQGGCIITLDKQPKHFKVAKAFFEEAGLVNVDHRLVDALEDMQRFTQNQFDFVFIDADRAEYMEYLTQVHPLVQSGGMIVLDNMFTEKTTEVEQWLEQHDSYMTSQLEIDSGIMIALKK